MFAQETVNDTGTVPISLLDFSGEDRAIISAETYKWISDRHLGTKEGLSWAFGQNGSTLTFIAVEDINYLREVFTQLEVNEKNLKAIRFLDEWFAEPDDLGDAFWDDFEKELEANRFSIP